MKLLTIAALAFVIFAAGAAVARAQFVGWERLSAPCVPTGIAMNASEIAAICPGDRTVYVKQR